MYNVLAACTAYNHIKSQLYLHQYVYVLVDRCSTTCQYALWNTHVLQLQRKGGADSASFLDGQVDAMQSTKRCSRRPSTPSKLTAVNKKTSTSARLQSQLSCFMRAPLWLRGTQESEPSWTETRWRDCLCASSCFFDVSFFDVWCSAVIGQRQGDRTAFVHALASSMIFSFFGKWCDANYNVQ